jgi:LmbE family N-acetylglucosaminyl deacetylase
MEEIAAKLRELIDRLRPEVLITWGPDGLTGHQDHRATGNIVSQVFQQHGKLTFRPSRLYYVAWPESVLAAAPPPFNGPGFGRAVADDLITTAIDCAKDTPAAYKAISCHKTQWDSATMKHFDEMNVKVLAGKIYLREAYAAKRGNRKEPDLFPRR